MKTLRTFSWALGATALVLFLMAAFPGEKAEAWLTFDEFTWAIAADSLVTNRFYGRATFSDTLRMRSDTTVALIFLRGRADSAWAFKARNGTTTWKTLLYQDTAGNTTIGGTSVGLTIASGGGNVNALRYYTNATANPLEIYNAIAPHRVFIGGRAAGDSTGGGVMIDSTGGGTVLRPPTGEVLVVISDTLKAKVVATTAMSSIRFVPRGSSAGSEGVLYSGFTNSNAQPWGVYAVAGDKQHMIINPHKYWDGAKVINDSCIVYGISKAATDTLFMSRFTIDSLGVMSGGGPGGGTNLDTIPPTGSRAVFRKAHKFANTDTSNYPTGYQFGWNIFSDAALTDTIFITGVELKYHTIP